MTETRLEEKMLALGRERYAAETRKNKSLNKELRTPAFRRLWAEATSVVGQELSERIWQNFLNRGPIIDSYAYIQRLGDAELVAAVALRCVLDGLSIGHNYKTLCKRIGNALEKEDEALQFAEQLPWRERVAQFWQKKGKKNAIAKAIKLSKSHEQLTYAPWPHKNKIYAGATLLEIIKETTGYIRFDTHKLRPNRSTARVLPTDALLKWLEEANDYYADARPMLLPIQQPPLDWSGPIGGGYHHTQLRNKTKLVSTRFVFPENRADYTDMPEVYDAVNHVQRVEWELHPVVHETFRTLWEGGAQVAGIPAKEDEPLPERPDTEDKDAIRTWLRNRKAIHQINFEHRCARLKLTRLLWIAETYKNGPIYFPQYLDFRGRMYPRPIFLQPQADDLARGMLRFAQGKAITDWDQARWLAIHVANCWGHSKKAFDERVAWTEANTARIQECYRRGPVDDLWWTEADDPWQFLAALVEWSEFKAAGLGFVSKLPVYMDGSNNGLQVFSFLLRDPVGGAATNCLPSTQPRDIYQDVADVATKKLIAILDGETLGSSRRAHAQWWLELCGGALPRAATKRAVMVLPYGGTLFSCREYVAEWASEVCKKKGTTYLAGRETWPRLDLVARAIWDAIGEVVIAAKVAMKWIQTCTKAMTEQKLPLKWKSPSGFPVVQAYHQYKSAFIQIRHNGAKIRKVSYARFVDRLDAREQRNGASPNFIHSIDGAIMVKVVNACAERGVTNISPIHDSFGVCVADVPILNHAVRETYASVFQRNLLADFREQLASYATKPELLPPPPEMGTMDVTAVMDSLYFSC